MLLTDQACSLHSSSCVEAMNYTDVLRFEDLQRVRFEVKDVAVHVSSGQRFAAPVTARNQKILFELSHTSFHDISDQHDVVVRPPHDSSESQAIPLHIVVNAEAAESLDKIDRLVKDRFREHLKIGRAEWAAEGGLMEECPSWIPLVKTSSNNMKVMMADAVLGNSDVATEMLLLKPDGTVVEGTGIDFVNSQLGGLDNLQNYSCNPILELAWIMHRETENAHRLRVRIHSIMFKEKVRGPPLKRIRMDPSKIQRMIAESCITPVGNTF